MKALAMCAFAAATVSGVIAACGPLFQTSSNEGPSSGPSDAGTGINYLDAIEACYRVPKSCDEGVKCINYVLASMGKAPIQDADWCKAPAKDAGADADAGSIAVTDGGTRDAGACVPGREPAQSWWPTDITVNNWIAKFDQCGRLASTCQEFLACANYVYRSVGFPEAARFVWRSTSCAVCDGGVK